MGKECEHWKIKNNLDDDDIKTCEEIKKVLRNDGLTFDEEGNMTQELNDEVIEKIFNAFDEEYNLACIYSNDLNELIKTKIFRALKGNPRYIIQFAKESLNKSFKLAF